MICSRVPALILLSGFLLFVLSSCTSTAAAERRLVPPRSVTEVRLDDISRQVGLDPVRAIHLLEIYDLLYGPSSRFPDGNDPDIRLRLDSLRLDALGALEEAQGLAIEEGRWNDAASHARSLSSLGVQVERTGEEPAIVLQYAKEQLLEGNDLAAFLAAHRAHNLQGLNYDDAFLFFERAVQVRQRRTAAFFLGIISQLGRAASLPADLRTYAQGRDTAAEMIQGVATVIVDRGIRVDRGRAYPDRALGSAFFVDASGLLITNYHVIASEVDPSFRGSSRMYVRLGDASSPRIPARVIGWDTTLDLALIKTEITPDYVYSVVDWVVPMVGETIFAIGSPVGLERTVTQGIVSALGRRIALPIGDVFQIDAAVNQGNSGGPVINMEGRLVGVVFAGIEYYQGLNFAIPAERLARSLPAMLAGGKADRPWIGLTLSETMLGAEIVYVSPASPASDMQIPEGSLITAINGVPLRAPQGGLIPAAQDQLFALQPGELLRLDLSSPEGEASSHLLRLASRPAVPMVEAVQMDSRERVVAPLFGLHLYPQGGNNFFSSYVVRKVVRGSIADEMSFSPDDPVSIRSFRIFEREGFAVLDINVRRRTMGFLETTMRLTALLDIPDTL
ncbi:MAG: S1C family serine protease [Treponema sp.]|nr:S1C family serine protease [Treponema sp.]